MNPNYLDFEQPIAELQAKGIDDNVARQIQVAFYSVRLMGDFDNVITAFENLKVYNRLMRAQVEGQEEGVMPRAHLPSASGGWTV